MAFVATFPPTRTTVGNGQKICACGGRASSNEIRPRRSCSEKGGRNAASNDLPCAEDCAGIRGITATGDHVLTRDASFGSLLSRRACLTRLYNFALVVATQACIGTIASNAAWPSSEAPVSVPPTERVRGANGSLLQRLNAKAVRKVIFNAPPKRTQYPRFLLGTWTTIQSFSGFELLAPESGGKISKRDVIATPEVPGFQVLSIAAFADIGTNPKSPYLLRFTDAVGDSSGYWCVKDEQFCFSQSLNAQLQGLDASKSEADVVDSIEYSGAQNPNRISIALRPGAVRNAERIELFRNGAETERPVASAGWFLVREQWRQVALGYSTSYGRARTIATDYAHVWGFRPRAGVDAHSPPTAVDAFCCTFAYANERQTPALFDAAGTAPLAIFQHRFELRKT